VVNGDGKCKKKLNYSLGLTEQNALEMGRILVVNYILRAYRKMRMPHKFSERDVMGLLHPALDYYYSTFSTSDKDVIDFGLDVLSAQRLFYQDEVFKKILFSNRSKDLQSYSDIKSIIDSMAC
ncbi:hypothetical protein NW915_16645, partial [Enterobacter hormaechei subsp. hoffmannii]